MRQKTKICAWVLFSAVSAVHSYAATDDTGRRFIYLAGAETPSQSLPTVESADQWESNKMYETAPGSNVYEIVKDTRSLAWGRWFRFYSDLADGLPDGSEYLAYNMNLIQPGTDGAALYPGANGIMSSDDMYESRYDQRTGTWCVPEDGVYRFRVDLRRHRLTVIPQNTPLMIVNSEYSADSIASYPSLAAIAGYYPAGPLQFSVFDAFADKWLNPAGNAALSTGLDIALSFTESDVKGEPFRVDGWTGGVIKGQGWGNRLDIVPDDMADAYTPVDLDAIYVVGGFTGWSFTTVSRESGAEAIYKVALPAGTTDFKLTLDSDWSSPQIGSRSPIPVIADGVANYSLLLSSTGTMPNHTVDNPLGHDAILTVNLTRGTASISSDVNLELASASSLVPVDRDQLFVEISGLTAFTPWKDCSDGVLSCFDGLSRQADGTYSGSFEVPAGQFKVRFISGLPDKGAVPTVMAPPTGNDREIVTTGGEAYSSAALLSADNAGYWTLTPDKWTGGRVTATVTPGDAPSVKFELGLSGTDGTVGQLYVIGTPNGWSINNGSIVLRPTDKGGYYGSFEADAGTPIFRFYSQLGDWESNSYGSTREDMVADEWDYTPDEVHLAYCTRGKGSYAINGWPGGTVYTYVDLAAARVTISDSPISSAGQIIDPASVKHVYLYSNGQYRELDKTENGMYTTTVNTGLTGEGLELRLFTRKLPLSPEEPEWEGSYALSADVAQPVAYDKFNVAEFGFVSQDTVTTAGATPFRTQATEETYAYQVTVDMENSRLYVERLGHSYILYGAISNGKVPTYANRAEFSDLVISRNGTAVNIPAGKFGFAMATDFATASADAIGRNPLVADLAGGYFHASDPWTGSLLPVRYVQAPDWKGGDVIVAGAFIADPAKIGDLKINFYKYPDGNAALDISETAPDSRVYTGRYAFSGTVSFDFTAFGADAQPLAITSNTYWPGGTGWNFMYNEGRNRLVPSDGIAAGKVGFHGVSFFMPSLVGEGEIDITLDLNDFSLTAKVDKANEGNVYEIVSDGDNSLDGATGYPSSSSEDTVVISASAGDTGAPGEQNIAFNLTTPDGKVIVPAAGADTEISFDKNGNWSGAYTDSPAPAADTRTALRRTAARSGKWFFSLPAATSSEISMMVDEANHRLTVSSSAHNRGFYIVSADDYGRLGIENIGEMAQNVLEPVADGIYEAEYTIPGHTAGTPYMFLLAKSSALTSGISPVSSAMATAEISEARTSASLLATDRNGISPFTVVSPAPVVRLRFDSNQSALTVSYDPAGIENISAEADILTVAAAQGGIRITASREATVAVYTLAGQLVKMIDVTPGTTFVSLAGGLYIANGTKLSVR